MEWHEDQVSVEVESQEVEPVDLARAFHFVHTGNSYHSMHISLRRLSPGIISVHQSREGRKQF
jgi:hypothetical protein